MNSQRKKIAVLGAGLMGHGIAQIAAQSGIYDVAILDINEQLLKRGMNMIQDSISKFVSKGVLDNEKAALVLNRIKPTLDLKEAVKGAVLVIEAATEDPKLKLDLFHRVAELIEENAIFASNTSSISITLLGAATRRPENVCGMHFFNPPQLMPLVEIIKGAKTSERTIQVVREIAESVGKQTVLCKKDSPGFIVNRILVPALNEAVFLVHEGVADPADIDKAVKLGLNWPMGPLTLLDYVGLDTTLNIVHVFLSEFQDSKYRPSPLLTEMVRAGLLGRKSGRGFFEWPSMTSPKTK
jgi:3-hydroxybutyryl-CoA dehydrogenase